VALTAVHAARRVVTSRTASCAGTTCKTVALGRWGEELAARELACARLSILARNGRCPYGEADLLVLDGTRLVTVEVKTTTVGKFSPEVHITRSKLRRRGRIQADVARRRAERGWHIAVLAIQVNPGGTQYRYTPIRNAYL
jgi:putative endonuclease